MTDLLLAAILVVLLFQLHAKEKNVGKYGRLCVFLEKRAPEYFVSQWKKGSQKIKDKYKEVKHAISQCNL